MKKLANILWNRKFTKNKNYPTEMVSPHCNTYTYIKPHPSNASIIIFRAPTSIYWNWRGRCVSMGARGALSKKFRKKTLIVAPTNFGAAWYDSTPNFKFLMHQSSFSELRPPSTEIDAVATPCKDMAEHGQVNAQYSNSGY